MEEIHQEYLIDIRDLKKWFPVRKGFFSSLFGRGNTKFLKAVDGVSFTIKPGEILGLAGESGCGKSTTGMTTLKLYEATSGEIIFQSHNMSELKGKQANKDFRRKAQIVFQNPYESLNPRFTVFKSVDEPVRNHYPGRANEHYDRVVQALERAGLLPPVNFLDRYPHELSGGQLQRVAIARAISVEPAFLVADEPVSMLDVSVRAGILNLLKYFADELDMGILYISHDLSTMKYICDSIGIMYLGKIIEIGKTAEVLRSPKHPYTKALVAAIPLMRGGANRKRVSLEGAVPNPVNLPPGCRFHSRCPEAEESCSDSEPELVCFDDGVSAACHKFT